jgi:hypothetical protein
MPSRGIRGGEDLDVLGVANLLASVDVNSYRFHRNILQDLRHIRWFIVTVLSNSRQICSSANESK